MKLMTIAIVACTILTVPVYAGPQKMRDAVEKAQTPLELIDQLDNIEQIGWQAMLAGKTLPACQYFRTKISWDEENIMNNNSLLQANQLCCATRELNLAALSTFIVENAPLLVGTKSSDGIQKIVDIIADRAGRDKLVDGMKDISVQSTQTLIKQCSIVTGSYEAARKR